jgi:hypothetical protein
VATRRGQRSARWISALVVFFCAAAAAPAAREYRTEDVGTLRITIDTDWAPRSAPGYLPARFEITNMGDARVIEIIAQGSRVFVGRTRGAGSGSTITRQSVRLAMGDRVKVTMPVPIYADSESLRFEIQERGRLLLRFNYSGFQSRAALHDASALVVAAAGSPTSGVGLRTARVPAGRSTPAPTLDFVLEPSRLPSNWLGYTSLRAVVIGPIEWGQMSDGQKSALLTWTASGGDLIFVNGEIKTLVPSAKLQPGVNPDRMIARHLFGRIHALNLTSLAPTGLSDLLLATETDRELHLAMPANTAPDWGNIEGRGFRLRIPGIQGVPARVYLGILILFSFLIGPVNYWLLRRRRQQVLVVLTAPLISAAFIVLLAGYAIAGEGFHVQGRAVTFTMLDQVNKQAATRATVSLYAAGMTPSAGLTFPRDAAVYTIGPEGMGLRDRVDLNLTDAQHYASGVLQARSPTNLEQVTARAARERLTFSRGDAGMEVTNGLEASIVALLYRDGDTIYRLDGSVSSGGKHTLKAAPFNPLQAIPEGLRIPAKFVDIFQNQPRGSYIAVLDRSPFWEPGVSGLVERGSLHIVMGWPEGQQ